MNIFSELSLIQGCKGSFSSWMILKKIILGIFISLVCFVPKNSFALDLVVKENVWSSSKFGIVASQLFNSKDLPNSLKAILDSKSQQFELGDQGLIVFKKESLTHWLRDSILKYNASVDSEANKVRLLVPEYVRIHDPKKKPTIQNIKNRIVLKAKTHCPSCDIDISVSSKDLPASNLFSSWNIGIDEGEWKGEQTVSINFSEKNYKFPVKIRWYDYVVTAKVPISVGRSLSSQNMKIERKDVTFLPVEYLTSFKKVKGLKAAKRFSVGQPIEKMGLVKAKIISFGQIVTVTVSEGAFDLSVTAKAVGSGAEGEIIPVEISNYKKTVMAEIIDSKRVRVR